MKKHMIGLVVCALALVGIIVISCVQGMYQEVDTESSLVEGSPVSIPDPFVVSGQADAPLINKQDMVDSDDKMMFMDTDGQVIPNPAERVINYPDINQP